MALLEVTDDYFMKVHEAIEMTTKTEKASLQALSGLYYIITSLTASATKLSSMILDSLQYSYLDKLSAFFEENKHFIYPIKENYCYSQIHREPTILLVYYWIRYHKSQLLEVWPLTRVELEPLAHDIGETLPQ
jgi:hypothetical protein